MAEHLHQRIRNRLKALNKSAQRASLDAGLSRDYLRTLFNRKGSVPKGDNLASLADALQTTPSWLLYGDNETASDLPTEIPRSTPSAPSGRVSFYGKAAGSIIGADILSSEAVDEIAVPQKVAQIKGAYALWVEGESMSPKFVHGEPIIAAPNRPVRKSDYVVVQVFHEGKLRALIKRFISKDAARLKLEQYNPASFIEIPVDQVHRVDRVLEPWETWG